MKRLARPVVIGLTTTLLAASSAAPPAFADVHHRHHRTARAHPSGESPARHDDIDAGAADGARNGGQGRGLYAGAGGIFSPGYEVPDPGTIHLGGQLLGGDFGKAYEDYYRHYYYYKYAYCPVGTTYVIYARKCVGLGNLFQ